LCVNINASESRRGCRRCEVVGENTARVLQDAHLLRRPRHRCTIPLLRQRHVNSDAIDFRLHDFFTATLASQAGRRL
jgi:hypothetical protein